MPFNVVQTTAEDLIGVLDAVLAKPLECTKEYVCEFADISTSQAENALQMAREMNLIELEPATSFFSSSSYLARLIISARSSEHKAALLRLILEQYEPYVTFKNRFLYNGSLDTAAKQVKSLFSMNSSYKDIKNTFINIATYAKAMINDGAGSYKFNQDDVTYVEILDLALKFKSNDTSALQQLLGVELYDYLDKENVFAPLSDAYSKLQTEQIEQKPIILYAGNAFESFLQQVANDNSISLSGKNGIIQKSNSLAAVISKKHRGMVDYIGQVRNAADHGTDPDEDGKTWIISEETAILYPLLITSLIKDIYNYQKGQITV